MTKCCILDENNKMLPLTHEEAVDQLHLYQDIFRTSDQNEINEIKNKMKLSLSYDLRGVRKAVKDKDEIRIERNLVIEVLVGRRITTQIYIYQQMM